MDGLKFDERGLIPAIVQDARTREVLTLAYMNAESLARTQETGETWFWSRSRQELWHKGATSGHTQRVVEIRADCDQDALVILAEPRGPACHNGTTSCFTTDAPIPDEIHKPPLGELLEELAALIVERQRTRPAGSYTTYLFDEGLDKILKKVGEEAAETIIAAKNADDGAFVGEVSDLLYHLLVLLAQRGTPLDSVRDELARRGQPKRLERS